MTTDTERLLNETITRAGDTIANATATRATAEQALKAYQAEGTTPEPPPIDPEPPIEPPIDPEPEPPPAEGEIVSVWSYDEKDGQVVVDARGVSDGQGNGLVRGAGAIVEGFDRSTYGDGRTNRVRFPQAADMPGMDHWVISGSAQPFSKPVNGRNAVIWSKDGGKVAGGISVEQFTTEGGTSMLRAYTRNAESKAVWLDGMAEIEVGQAFGWALHCDDDPQRPVRLYMRQPGGVMELVAWSSNGHPFPDSERPAYSMSYDDGLAPFHGIVGPGALFSGKVPIETMNGFPSPVTTDWQPPAPPLPGPGEFEAFNGRTVNTQFANRGTIKGDNDLGGGTQIAWDMRGTTFTTDWERDRVPFSPINIRHNLKLVDCAIAGGTFMDHYGGPGVGANGSQRGARDDGMLRGYVFRRGYPSPHGGQILVGYAADVDRLLIEGCRFHECWDPVRPSHRTPDRKVDGTRVVRCWFTDTIDEVIENDSSKPNVTLEDSLCERTFVFWSDRNEGTAGRVGGVCTARKNLVWLYGVYDKSYKHWQQFEAFKLDGRSTDFDLFDNVFRIDRIDGRDYPNRHPFKGLLHHKKLRNSSGNVILWTGSGNYPGEVPPGFTVVKGSAAMRQWDDMVVAWKARYYGPRIPGLD